VTGKIQAKYIFLEYLLLIAVGLSLASLLHREFLFFSWVLLAMGVIYNVRPMRSKDRAYLDVLSESVNNPLRLLLGWSALVSGSLLPSSILIAYWMGGAFLMAVKRYAEYRSIGDPERAGLYRRSFRSYSERTLLLSAFFYAINSAFFLAIFLIKYRIELMLSFPLFAILFVWYLAIGMRPAFDGSGSRKVLPRAKLHGLCGCLRCRGGAAVRVRHSLSSDTCRAIALLTTDVLIPPQRKQAGIPICPRERN